MAATAEELDVDGIAVRLTNPDKVYFPELGSDGTKRRLLEYYRAGAGGPAARPPDPPATLSRRHRRRGDLSEEGAAASSGLSEHLPGDVSIGAHRRRAQGDPSRRDRLGRADGAHHGAPVAGLA